jgi:hypothetical protein
MQLLQGLASRPIAPTLAARQARMRAQPERVQGPAAEARYHAAVTRLAALAQDFA